ncbi:MAG TPA: FAD-binding oxidoreductase [Bryobacterales bacterium]|nr:FAD-binding oxidoreductase [Bryobacterales bacterium]
MDSKHVRAVVVTRREISSELWVVRIRPEERIAFEPGQYVTVGVASSPRMIERPYSVVSAPREPELEFFLELVPNGELTPHLYGIPVGGEVFLRRAAKGRFVLDAESGHRKHFLVATVTGVAPYVSMVRELAARATAGETVPYRLAVLHAASFSQELGYFEELSALARDHSWLRYIPTISRIWLDPGWQGEVGRAEDVTRKHLDALGFTAAGTTAYVCGNPVMIENVKGVLQRAGFTKESVREEIYWVAEKSA